MPLDTVQAAKNPCLSGQINFSQLRLEFMSNYQRTANRQLGGILN